MADELGGASGLTENMDDTEVITETLDISDEQDQEEEVGDELFEVEKIMGLSKAHVSKVFCWGATVGDSKVFTTHSAIGYPS